MVTMICLQDGTELVEEVLIAHHLCAQRVRHASADVDDDSVDADSVGGFDIRTQQDAIHGLPGVILTWS